ncbi:unnamed protein product, partial [Rangifer tarandus platyrhynchus]
PSILFHPHLQHPSSPHPAPWGPPMCTMGGVSLRGTTVCAKAGPRHIGGDEVRGQDPRATSTGAALRAYGGEGAGCSSGSLPVLFTAFPFVEGMRDGKESACCVGGLGWEDPVEEGMATHSSILAWRIPMDRGAWQASKESDIHGLPGGSDGKESACCVGGLGWEDPVEEGMATHSSILAWRIPMDRGAWQASKESEGQDPRATSTGAALRAYGGEGAGCSSGSLPVLFTAFPF